MCSLDSFTVFIPTIQVDLLGWLGVKRVPPPQGLSLLSLTELFKKDGGPSRSDLSPFAGWQRMIRTRSPWNPLNFNQLTDKSAGC